MLNLLPTKTHRGRRFAAVLVAVLLAASLHGCGSTKVYSANKTVVYRDNIYNVSDVKLFSHTSEAVFPGDSNVDLDNIEKRAFESLLEDHNDEVFVRQSFTFDDQAVVYQAQNVDSWSDFERMNRRFDDALEDLREFLADEKETQLELD
ncbi:hypothetical protein F3N42_00185 [Marinihelvus fidelis]|uniref:Uncharacterized protein n=1 Tax=Marinihelvus fidelis TaxID=2613842 RepID=A0A5N0TIT3_9GAMM|nr:hypothetical protein [Marinihelvus fidelis]KAA9134007.1 hypothetical protein F3N42_00185 [Marinihelvus fidelis]